MLYSETLSSHSSHGVHMYQIYYPDANGTNLQTVKTP